MNTKTSRKVLIFQLVYYLLVPIVYAVFFFASSLLLEMTHTNDLGTVMALTYGVLFVLTPVLTLVLMRFSLFGWYLDPIAAAEIPLFLYVSMLINLIRRTGNIASAFLLLNADLADDFAQGWIFLIVLFAFALVCTFSFARVKKKSISYRIIEKIKIK